MSEKSKKTLKLEDYTPSHFNIDHVDLTFEFSDTTTTVTNKMTFSKNLSVVESSPKSLSLNGVDLKMTSIKLNQEILDPKHYEITDEGLTLLDPTDLFQLEIVTELSPTENTSYEGLYCSNGFFVTQNEAQGFRKISYFLDRPDVMTTFRTTLIANKEKHPTLLSNGNLKNQKDLENGMHSVTWDDPIKKPCYLFAVVAGNLGSIKDQFTTMNGKIVDLIIYCEKGNEDRCHHAMNALKLSMKWDEDKYGREYDLDIYMIVAADNFNAGAMENKGLNVFNSTYVLANTATATDQDYENILGVIAHEYFHNWTGNRITLRDWFQLSLKEGLTVFRDQEFSIDMISPIKRLDDVTKLRTRQFAEDAGPTAHPVQPKTAISVDNFFTLTIYEKGAEVIRMIQTIVQKKAGNNAFRKGMDLYFERFDESAVTIEDFVKSFEDANNIDLTQFRRWYHQSGTPLVRITSQYNQTDKTYSLSCEQSGGEQPFYIPLKMALLNNDGSIAHEDTLILKETKNDFTFKNIEEKPTLSMLRDFSAPVRLEYNYNDQELALLMSKDNNIFTQWEAGQQFFLKETLKEVSANKSASPEISSSLIDAYTEIIENKKIDAAFKSRLLEFPEESYISQFVDTIDVDAIHKTRNHLISSIALKNKDQLLSIYQELSEFNNDGHSQEQIDARSLKNNCLSLLSYLQNDSTFTEAAYTQLTSANNMTDALTALNLLNSYSKEEQERATAYFYEIWNHESLVMNKFLKSIAMSPLNNALENIKKYSLDKIFDNTNPNKVYSLFLGYALANPTQFHKVNGEGYQFIGEKVVEMDRQNPHVGSYLAKSFNDWKKFTPERKKLMHLQLENIASCKDLSKSTYEIISKSLD